MLLPSLSPFHSQPDPNFLKCWEKKWITCNNNHDHLPPLPLILTAKNHLGQNGVSDKKKFLEYILSTGGL